MKRIILVLVMLVLIILFICAQESKTPEIKPYNTSVRIQELVQETNKLQNAITARIEQIKGAVAELQKVEQAQKKEVKQEKK